MQSTLPENQLHHHLMFDHQIFLIEIVHIYKHMNVLIDYKHEMKTITDNCSDIQQQHTL